MTTRPIIPRVGGKFYSYKKIVSMMPDLRNKFYVEPFVGGGSIFFNKPKARVEVINDFDEEMVNLYRVAQLRPIELSDKKYTQEDLDTIFKSTTTDAEERAINTQLKMRLTFAGRNKKLTSRAVSIPNTNKNQVKIHEKLRDTIIENEDYKIIINKYDSPNTFFFLDPPYEDSKRTTNTYNSIDLKKLRDMLLTIKGDFMMTINDSKNVRKLFKDFDITTFTTKYTTCIKKRDDVVVELLIRKKKRTYVKPYMREITEDTPLIMYGQKK
jgi:DNA adenine methylase